MRLTGVLLGALALVAGPTMAAAQDANIVEGPGYKVGEGTVVHPDASIEAGFTSNTFRNEGNVPAGIIRMLISASLASAGPERTNNADTLLPPESGPSEPPKVSFRFGGQLGWEQYIAFTNDANERERVQAQSNFPLELDGEVIAYPQGRTSFKIRDQFERTTEPRKNESAGSLTRDINELYLGLDHKPGGGALLFGARYQNLIDRFESPDSAFANRMNHTVSARAEWQWLPITRLFADASFGFFGGLGGDSTKTSSNPLRIAIGAASAITERTTLRGNIGFGKGFYSAGSDFTNVIGGLQFGYRYSPFGRITTAYSYNFQDSMQANFYRDHALIVRLDQQLGRVVLDGGFGARLRAYRGDPMTAHDAFIVDGFLRGHYVFRDWLAAVAAVNIYSDNTSDGFISYQRFDLFAGLNAAF